MGRGAIGSGSGNPDSVMIRRGCDFHAFNRITDWLARHCLPECFFCPLKGLVQDWPFLLYAGRDFLQQSQIAVQGAPDILTHFLAGE